MTRDELRRALKRLELGGEAVVVHAHLRALGLDDSTGAASLCEALVEAVGPGTILVPSFTPQTIVAKDANDQEKAPTVPIAFHPDLPTSDPVGEVFRQFPGALRSQHPTHSFVALGPLARELLSTHRDNNPLGPLKKLNLHRGRVVLLGTNLQHAAALHLALEEKIPAVRARRTALRINAAGYVERIVVDHFPGCGRAFDKLEPLLGADSVTVVALPNAVLRKIPLRHLLHVAYSVLQQDPTALFCSQPDCATCVFANRRLSSVRLT